MLVGASKCLKQIIQIELNRINNPNWQEANQLAIYKHGRGFELGTTVNKLRENSRFTFSSYVLILYPSRDFEITSLGLHVPCSFADPSEFAVFHELSLAQGFLLPLYFALSFVLYPRGFPGYRDLPFNLPGSLFRRLLV